MPLHLFRSCLIGYQTNSSATLLRVTPAQTDFQLLSSEFCEIFLSSFSEDHLAVFLSLQTDLFRQGPSNPSLNQKKYFRIFFSSLFKAFCIKCRVKWVKHKDVFRVVANIHDGVF